MESLQKSISKPGNGFESRSNKYSARGLVVGRDGKKTKNKKQKTKKKRKKSRVTSSFFNRGTVVIEADLISIAKTRRREGGCGMNREDRKFENVRVFE